MYLFHNKAIDFQLQQLYHALGVALALNRTLVMPKMLCFCARNWFETDHCRLPGDVWTQLPFVCTGDQVFVMEELLAGTHKVRGRPPGGSSISIVAFSSAILCRPPTPTPPVVNGTFPPRLLCFPLSHLPPYNAPKLFP